MSRSWMQPYLQPSAPRRLLRWLVAGFMMFGVSGRFPATLAVLAAEPPSDDADVLTFVDRPLEVQGTTAGQYGLFRLAARDRRRKLCLGYAAQQPDFRLVLREPQSRLRIAVDSSGGDTTLFVQGPEGIDCNDNARREHRDAAISGAYWPAGTYRIWVGAFAEGDRLDYLLSISRPERDRP